MSSGVLIVRSGRLGDFLVSVPAIAAIRQRYRGARITLLTGFSGQRNVATHASSYANATRPAWLEWVQPEYVDNILVFKNPRSPHEWALLRKQLSEASITSTYILPYFRESCLSRIKKRAWLRSLGVRGTIQDAPNGDWWRRRPRGFPWQAWLPLAVGTGPDLTSMVREQSRWRHSIVAAARRLSRRSVADLLGDFRRPLVVLMPGATHSHKQWDVAYFSAVGAELISRHSAYLCIVGAEPDKSVAAEVCQRIGSTKCSNVCGDTSLHELAALMSEADLCVGNDGGPAHLAAMVGAPVVCIFSGVHEPGIWDPLGERVRIVRAAIYCQGCKSEYGCPERHNRCMKDIPVSSVLEACEELISKGRDVRKS